MKKFEDLDGVADVLGGGGPFSPDIKYETVGEVVDTLVNLGRIDSVIAVHDDHLGLKDELTSEFLSSPLEGLDTSRFESQIEAVLEQANIIIPLSEKDPSEDDTDDIEEDKRSRDEDFND